MKSFQHYADLLCIEPYDKVLTSNLRTVLNEAAGKQIFTEHDVESFREEASAYIPADYED